MIAEKEMRTKVCPECEMSFSYEMGLGNDRIICGSKRCRNKRTVRLRKLRIPRLKVCKNPKCDSPADRVTAGLCNTCYFRVRRNGHFGKMRRRTSDPKSYLQTRDRQHPLARQSDGMLYEHRRVAYEKHGPECGDCYWCGVRLDWSTAKVDHVNAVKSDNRPDNLVLACESCNVQRAAMLSFCKRALSERVEEMIDAARKCNRTNGMEGEGSRL